MRVEFLTIPPVGTLMMLDDQAYRLTVVEPYTRRDGSPSRLLTWEASCAQCGTTFQVVTGMVATKIPRRCIDHRQPSVRVSSSVKRGASLTIRVIDPALGNIT